MNVMNIKIFVICHEALHIILNHGKRFQEKENPKIFNIAVDIVVNHSLVKDFGFIREEIDAKNEYCWIDTIFGEKNTMVLIIQTMKHLSFIIMK